MASPHGCRVWRPCPHRHRHSQTHRHHCPHCPLHRPHCPLHTHTHTHNPHRNMQPQPHVVPLPQNPHPFVPLTLPTSVPVHYKQVNSSNPQISQELEHEEAIELDDEEDDDEPVFVLTDEWREFFAKSEARRKLEKKQGKKGKK